MLTEMLLLVLIKESQEVKFLSNPKIANLSLTAVSENDIEFIKKVYISTRIDEFSSLGWLPEQLQAFLELQLNYQQKSYEMQFPNAENFVINLENERVGRMIVYQNESEIRLVDIAVLPAFRKKGIASQLINRLKAEANKSRRKLALQVLKNNSNAFNLYIKLGFNVISEDELYFSLEQ